jgi:outer membrane protein OmpA-like peptidoglycan-associated protein
MIKLFLTLNFIFWGIIPHAEEVIKYASPEELIQKLTKKNETKFDQNTRGLRNLVPENKESPSINLQIQFDFDSHTLSKENKPLLDNLIQAMKSDALRSSSFIVEGHTDASGIPSYNLKLSTQRAFAVTNYLTMNGIKKQRLKSVGKGSTELLIPSDPEAAENRRVKITLVSGS